MYSRKSGVALNKNVNITPMTVLMSKLHFRIAYCELFIIVLIYWILLTLFKYKDIKKSNFSSLLMKVFFLYQSVVPVVS